MHIGIDLGGTKTESIILDKAGKEIERIRKDTPKNYNGTLDTVCELVNYLEDKYKIKCSVGVGSPGALSKETNCIKGGNSTWLNDRPLKKDIELRLSKMNIYELRLTAKRLGVHGYSNENRNSLIKRITRKSKKRIKWKSSKI